MHKKIRESKMLELVRQWRAEAFQAMRGQTPEDRRRQAREWADRLGLPFLDGDDEPPPNTVAEDDQSARTPAK